MFKTLSQSLESQHYTMLFYGRPGCGKTLLAGTSQYMRTALINVDHGILSIINAWPAQINPGWRVYSPETSNQFDQAIEYVVKNLSSFDLLVVDTATEIQRIFVDGIVANRQSPIATLQDWGVALSRLEKLARLCRALPIHVVWTCHEMQAVDAESMRNIYRPAFQGQFGKLMYHKHFDVIGRLFLSESEVRAADGTVTRSTNRFLSCAPSTFWETKDRSDALPDYLCLPHADQVASGSALAPIDHILSLIHSRSQQVIANRMRENP